MQPPPDSNSATCMPIPESLRIIGLMNDFKVYSWMPKCWILNRKQATAHPWPCLFSNMHFSRHTPCGQSWGFVSHSLRITGFVGHSKKGSWYCGEPPGIYSGHFQLPYSKVLDVLFCYEITLHVVTIKVGSFCLDESGLLTTSTHCYFSFLSYVS